MNYFFTPFTLVNQYQPFYAYAHPLIIDASTYFIQSQKFQKQITLPQEQILLLNHEQVSQIQDQAAFCQQDLKSIKKREYKNFGFRDQDKERNIYSNILKAFFISLWQKRTMDDWLTKMLPENSKSLDLTQFLEKVKEIFGKNKSYFSPKQIRQTLKKANNNSQIGKIVGKCLYRFLKTQFSLTLLISSRIKKRSKLLQMRKGRELLSIISGTF